VGVVLRRGEGGSFTVCVNHVDGGRLLYEGGICPQGFYRVVLEHEDPHGVSLGLEGLKTVRGLSRLIRSPSVNLAVMTLSVLNILVAR